MQRNSKHVTDESYGSLDSGEDEELEGPSHADNYTKLASRSPVVQGLPLKSPSSATSSSGKKNTTQVSSPPATPSKRLTRSASLSDSKTAKKKKRSSGTKIDLEQGQVISYIHDNRIRFAQVQLTADGAPGVSDHFNFLPKREWYPSLRQWYRALHEPVSQNNLMVHFKRVVVPYSALTYERVKDDEALIMGLDIGLAIERKYQTSSYKHDELQRQIHLANMAHKLHLQRLKQRSEELNQSLQKSTPEC
eukprot:TRINITY_DN5006_c0_g1_i1.p1 TRINITY_DN5006_c0_g1~~TRINITY_DN5006_c0_g1_i1.p1  ORF type:complete len:249 (+),score=36.54 TRINITY_DN5006_c0_g1_i1:11-757(+)